MSTDHSLLHSILWSLFWSIIVIAITGPYPSPLGVVFWLVSIITIAISAVWLFI